MRINIPESAETMDIFLGVLANTGLIVLGTVIGCLFRSEKVKRVAERVFQLFALFVILMGVEGALGIKEPFKALIFMVLGTALGELIDIDKQMNRLGDWAQRKLGGKSAESASGDTGNGETGAAGNGETGAAGKGETGLAAGKGGFSEGMVQAVLLFCIGSMTFIGALESGIQHVHTTYITKGALDAIGAITFAAAYGPGVGLSALFVLLYQGLLVAGATLLEPVLLPEVVALSAQIGSLFLIGIGFNMLKLTKIKVANFLPAMFLPMIWQAISSLF